MSTSEIETAVAEILRTNGVTVSAVYRGEKLHAFGDETTADEWLFTVQNAISGRSEQFAFFTGLGLRGKRTAKIPDSGREPRVGTLMWAQLEKSRKPVKPHAASLLSSLFSDSCAMGQSFDSWCDEIGYDTDSRKAYAIYEACQKNADKLNRVIDSATREALAEVLQDY